jgi:hypothetical protein
MPITTLSTTLKLPNQALLFDLDRLYDTLRQVKDRRKRRGLQYPLAEILLIGVLAKLAGQTSSRAIAHWAKLRSQGTVPLVSTPADARCPITVPGAGFSARQSIPMSESACLVSSLVVSWLR